MGAIVEHGGRNWKRMAWTVVLSNLITWGPLAAVISGLIVSSLYANSLAGLIGLATSSYLLYFGAGASLVLAIFTVYSYPAVVIDNVSGVRAIKNSFNVASHNLGATVGYCVIRALFQFFLVILIVYLGGLILLPLASFSAAIFSFLVTPILHSTKTMIYYYSKPDVPEMPFEVSNPIWQDVWRRLPRAVWLKIRAGLSEAGRYVLGPRNLPFHLLSILAFGLGVLFGNYVSVNGLKSYLLSIGYVPGQGNRSVVFPQVIPPVEGANIFLNNWLVSIATGLAGIGFGAPSFTTILFNGFVLGILVPLSTLSMLLAAILPHGIIEIPSFILAGSMGLKLGYAGLKKFMGAEHTSVEGPDASSVGEGYLSRTLRQTVYVVVGLAPLFLIAGLIEADITPIIMRMFGWTF
jgi:stage II sporulation protein M